MNRIAIGTVFASALLALTLGACEDQRWKGRDSLATHADCAQLTSCDTCTPVSGCGWCFHASGAGTCAADPDQCGGSQFSWTWDPNGCRVAADASAVIPDGSRDANDAAAVRDSAPSDGEAGQ